ncbi:MAG TPA: hypothetical protein DCW90_15020 [Lachnospiraceae bacterium]|nr:hypothetical protein [uncultured Lachnoclostridium sp.]HAU86747.1 hypothetical protein [Lachnospiraceae bacterium]
MASEKDGITLVKLTKEEKIKQQEDFKKAKQDKLDKIPEQDRLKKKKYTKIIIETLVLFVLALIMLGLMAASVIPVQVGLIGLIIITVVSTYISRKDQ